MNVIASDLPHCLPGYPESLKLVPEEKITLGLVQSVGEMTC